MDCGQLVGSKDPKQLVTRYEYDFRGRLLSMDEPDAGKTEYVYRRDGSIRFSQNAKQAAKNQNQYSYTHYDQAGRPTESGEWTPNDASVSIRTLRTNKDLLEARNQDLPEGARADVVKTTYDKAVALPEGITGRTAQFLMGKVSYSEKLQSVAQPDGQLLLEPVSKSWYSYDERGRVEWMVQDIAGLGVKTVDYAYGPAGNVQLVSYQAGNEAEDFYHLYEYDVDTRLKAVYTDDEPPVYRTTNEKLLDQAATKTAFDLQASYEYYLHGPLKAVTLADGLQTTDYYYTVQGWLKAINNPNDTANPDNDVFAMQLDYFAGDYAKTGSGIQQHTVATEDFSGNIQQQTWQQQTNSTADFYSYQYAYDERYQLKSATFGRMSNGVFAGLGSRNLVTGLSYDKNGNLDALQRFNNEGTEMHRLAYQYADADHPNATSSITGYAKSYQYSALGQMVKQEKEDGVTEYFEYDVSGKAIGVYSYAEDAQGVWQYEEANLLHRYYYDEKGYRLRKEDVLNGKQTYYVRDASGNLLSTYERQTSTSDIERTEVPIYGSGRLGIAHRNTDNTLSYLYELKDHLGNVRSRLMRSEQGVDLVSWHTYYPFGLENQALSSSESSYPLRHRYQGEFAEYDQETKLNHFELRQYDAVVGRWLSVDPMGQFYSPYVGMGNNPVSSIDPDGGQCYDSDGNPMTCPDTWQHYEGPDQHIRFLAGVEISAGMSQSAASASRLGMYANSDNFWNHDVTQATLLVATSFIGAEAYLLGRLGTTTKFFGNYLKANRGPLRQGYEKTVKELKKVGEDMLANEYSKEITAQTMHYLRRRVGVIFKDQTPVLQRGIIYARNLLKYGDRLGPSFNQMRKSGKSLDEIIDSASKPGGRDLFKP